LGLIDKHRRTKRKISLDAQATPLEEEAQAEPEARRESNGSNDASRIPEEESPVVRHTQWSLWMGPGLPDSEEEEEKETTPHISDPNYNAVGSFDPKSEFPSECGSDSCQVNLNEETVDNRITPSTTPLVPVNFQGFTSSKLLKASNRIRTIK